MCDDLSATGLQTSGCLIKYWFGNVWRNSDSNCSNTNMSLRYSGSNQSPEKVLGRHTYFIGTISLFHNTTFHFTRVVSCDWSRKRQRKFAPAADSMHCYTCSRQKFNKDKEKPPTCTFNDPWGLIDFALTYVVSLLTVD